MREVVGNGRTVDEAKMNALRELGLDSEENVEIEVLDEGSKGVFGWGTKYARVKVRLVGEGGKKSSAAGKKSEPRRSGREKAEMPPITVGERPLPVPPPKERRTQAEEEKPERFERQERTERPERPERLERSPRPERQERPERFRKPERHRKPDRFKKPEERFEEEDKHEYEYETPSVSSYEEIGPELLEEEESGPFAPREIIRNIMNYMNLNGEIKLRNTRSGPVYSIEGENLGAMIGKHGQTLESVQFIVNLILLRRTERKKKITIDVEGYRSRREKSLQDLAKRLADKARREKRNIVLEPMLPSERRIIHLTLQDNPNISTFSQGEEPMRKVIISPKKRSNGGGGRKPRNSVEV
jgi:spoIIIJ-associated protein